MTKGTLFIVSAPSGGGKTSLMEALVAKMDNIQISISHTTRKIRDREQDGKNYFFITNSEFNKMASEGKFVEYANVFGNLYGTSKEWLEAKMNQGIDIVLELDWQGANSIKKIYKNTCSIYILPPSKEILAQRLKDRKQDDNEIIEKRMASARSELSHYDEYDFLVINQSFDRALLELMAIVTSDRLKISRQNEVNSQLIASLTA